MPPAQTPQDPERRMRSRVPAPVRPRTKTAPLAGHGHFLNHRPRTPWSSCVVKRPPRGRTVVRHRSRPGRLPCEHGICEQSAREQATRCRKPLMGAPAAGSAHGHGGAACPRPGRPRRPGAPTGSRPPSPGSRPCGAAFLLANGSRRAARCGVPARARTCGEDGGRPQAAGMLKSHLPPQPEVCSGA